MIVLALRLIAGACLALAFYAAGRRAERQKIERLCVGRLLETR